MFRLSDRKKVIIKHKRMKTSVLSVLFAAAVSFSLAGCSQDDPATNSTDATGTLRVNIDLDKSVRASATSRADGKEYDAVADSDLSIRLVSDDGSYDNTWALGDFPSGSKFKVGKYKVEAFYGSTESEGFESPYYYGTTDISFNENEQAIATIRASLANAMVSIDYTEAFKKYFASWTSDVMTATNTVTLLSDETRPVYVNPGEVRLFVDVTKDNGTNARLQPATFTAEARHHYHFTFDVAGGVGDAQLIVSFDDMLAQEDVTIDLSDELMASPAPVITPKGFTSGEAIHVTEGLGFNSNISLLVTARGTLVQTQMLTVSPDLTAKGWPADLDLCAASASQQSVLGQLGFKSRGIFDAVKSQLADIDMTEVLSNLKYVDGRSNENRFTFYAKDRMTKVSDEVVLIVIVDKLELELSNGYILSGGTELTANLAYSGPDIESNVRMQYRNERGTWSDCPYTATLASRAAQTYNITMTVPAGLSTYSIRAVFRDNESSASNIEVITPSPRELAIAAAPRDIWATHATISFISASSEYTDAQLAAQCTVMIADEAGSYTQASVSRGSDNTVRINGLTPGKQYSVFAHLPSSVKRASVPVTFTTEAATQLPNADMEQWAKGTTGSNYETMYPWSSVDGSPWGTNNPMTTSQGSDYAYVRISGTISTEINKGISVSGSGRSNKLSDTDCAPHGGSNAAIIQTVGWGSGNTAVGNNGSQGKTKYIDAGLLHLGASRSARPSGFDGVQGTLDTSDLNCGYSFGSRPTSFSFWYKYFPRNSADKGYVEIWVKDAAGHIIASNSQNLDASSAYRNITVELPYAAGCEKASLIYVKFTSTNSNTFLTKTNDNLTGPGFANLSRGTFMGSQLVIDDLYLNY